MKLNKEQLPTDPAELQRLVLELSQKLDDSERRYQHAMEQWQLALKRQFGRSSEAHPEQGDLFNEVEELVELEAKEVTALSSAPTKKSKPARKSLPKELPRQVIEHDLTDEEKVCDCCGHQRHRMGKERSEQLEFIPAKVQVIEHVRFKYACRHCEQHGTKGNITTAQSPASPIPKSYATASLLSQIITAKYQYALPLYRQEALFKQWQVELNRKTMADWMIKCATLFRPLYQALHHALLQQPVVHADETTVRVVKSDKLKHYMWVYCCGADSPVPEKPGIVLYEYQSGRHGEHPKHFLNGYQGWLQVDGYVGYEQTQATLVGCMAHARRRFMNAVKLQPQGKTGKANIGLNFFTRLYAIEAQLKDKSASQKRDTRQQQSVSILDKLKSWLDKESLKTPPKSALGDAISYTLNQWDKLIRYTEDGMLEIDNNRAERAIKPFVIGRKNWLFSNTAKGAEASAMLYSIIETAKANGLIPYDYVQHCLTKLAEKPEDVVSLLPWNISL